METITETTEATSPRRAAIGSLAIVGFIALILIGIATAIYAASFLPRALSHLSSANVYLSGQPNSLQAVGTTTAVTNTPAPTSIPVTAATTTVTSGTYTPAPAKTAPSYSYTAPTSYTYPSATGYTYPSTPSYTNPSYQVVPSVPSYYGLPDLVTTITSVGYLRNSGDTSSFIAANTVPNGYQGAVRFVVANRGTNSAGSWYFSADLPTNDGSGSYRSPYQRSLNPGDSILFTLGFDSSVRGNDSISIDADPNNAVRESNESNNDDSASVYLNGGSSYSSGGNYDSNGNYCTYGTYYQNGRYYCSSSNANNNSNGNYDSNGNYCSFGTYYQNGRYYCNSSNATGNHYDSNGNYCSYGTYYQNGRYYCDGPSGNNNSGSYDSNGNYCPDGTYYQNGRYYCDSNSNINSGNYDSNGNYCPDGSYYSNSTGRYYCY